MNGTEVATPPPLLSGSNFGHIYPRLSRAGLLLSERLRERRQSINSRKSYYYKLESESSSGAEDEDGTESVHSFQDKETDLAKDTSDSEWSETDSQKGSVIEYEVVSTDEDANDYSLGIVKGHGTSDTDDDIISENLINITMLEKGDGDFVFADSEDSASPSDAESSPRGYSKCAKCKNENNTMFRYCTDCYKERKEFFPPRPKRRRPKAEKLMAKESPKQNGGHVKEDVLKNDFTSRNFDFENIFVPKSFITDNTNNINNTHILANTINDNLADRIQKTPKKRIFESETEMTAKRVKGDELVELKNGRISSHILENESDHYASFSQPEFSIPVKPLTKAFSEQGIALSNKVAEVQSYSDNESNILLKARESKPNSKEYAKPVNGDSDKCIVCLVKPKTGIFAHGRIAHICCCYECSVKVWTRTKRCPICKCKVSNVLKAHFL